ncbi:MAG: hypothetical protein LBD18_02245 [Treponema sp.]|nr:hypothetical protein [Treponema sp.]
MALQMPKFYLAGSKRARKSGFLRSIDRKNPQFEQALKLVRGSVQRAWTLRITIKSRDE